MAKTFMEYLREPHPELDADIRRMEDDRQRDEEAAYERHCVRVRAARNRSYLQARYGMVFFPYEGGYKFLYCRGMRQKRFKARIA